LDLEIHKKSQFAIKARNPKFRPLQNSEDLHMHYTSFAVTQILKIQHWEYSRIGANYGWWLDP
jgi:hypothetical protein